MVWVTENLCFSFADFCNVGLARQRRLTPTTLRWSSLSSESGKEGDMGAGGPCDSLPWEGGGRGLTKRVAESLSAKPLPAKSQAAAPLLWGGNFSMTTFTIP